MRKPERTPFELIDHTIAGTGHVDRQVTDYIRRLQVAVSEKSALSLLIATRLKLLRDREVFLFTGFVVPGRYPQGENDGPLGTIALARSLARAGVIASVWVDPQLLDNVRWLAAEIGLETPVRAIDLDELEHLSNRPAAAIAIEKPGVNEKNTMHTFDGIAIESGSISIDHIFRSWGEEGVLTIGIGDRGNEIGFGSLRDQIVRLHPDASSCCCGCGGTVVSSTPTHLLLPAAVSNWGAYGIVAALAILCNNEELLLGPDEEARLLQVAAVRGCVDGIRQRGSFGVDGISGQASVAVVEELQRIALRALESGSNENACA